MACTQTAVFRLQKDVKEVVQRFGYNSENPPIFITAADNAVDHVFALVVGPPETPYDAGYFLFDIRASQNYPNAPPEVRIMSTAWGAVRFNPNLYAGGKVCLSILGTWKGERGGSENWRSSYSIGYILQCVQCMIMNSEPFFNEPGFDKELLSQLTSSGTCPSHGFGFRLPAVSGSIPADDNGTPGAAAATEGTDPLAPPGQSGVVVGEASTVVAAAADDDDDENDAEVVSLSADKGQPSPPSKSPAYNDSTTPATLASPAVQGPAAATAANAAAAAAAAPGAGGGTNTASSSKLASVSPEANVYSNAPTPSASPHQGFPAPEVSAAATTGGGGHVVGSASTTAAPAADHSTSMLGTSAASPISPQPKSPSTTGAASPFASPPPPSALLAMRNRNVVVDDATAARIRASVLAASESYTIKLHHESVRVTVCDALDALLKLPELPAPTTPTADPGAPPPPMGTLLSIVPIAAAFEPELKRLFRQHYEIHLAGVLNPPKRPLHAELASKYPGQSPATLRSSAGPPPPSSGPPAGTTSASSPLGGTPFTMLPAAAAGEPYNDGDAFEVVPFEGAGNACRGRFQYAWLAQRLRRINDAVEAETKSWAEQGVAETASNSRIAFALKAEVEVVSDVSPVVCASPVEDDNAFVWAFTLMPTEGTYADSAYIVDVVFHPAMAEPPRCRFRHAIWHPNVSPGGVPFDCANEASTASRGSRTLTYRPSDVARSLIELLTKPPLKSAGAQLNREAAAAAFSNDQDVVRQFRRKARNLAQRTLDG